MAVKMRISKTSTKCTSCNKSKKDKPVKEMYDLCFGDDIFHLCQLCMADLLRLTCKANSEYYARLKSRDEVR